jgi:hypothetical protein
VVCSRWSTRTTTPRTRLRGPGHPAKRPAKTIPAGGTCGKKPCWSAVEGKGFNYKNKLKDDPIDIQTLKLTAGPDGRAKISLTGKGDGLGFASLPLTPEVTVQLHNDESGLCWSASYSSLITKNDAERFAAKGDSS